MSTYHVENFGCRATQADGAALERQFFDRGLARAANAAHADLVVINSCTVTAAADHDARAAIRRLRRHNPNAKIVVTGCYAQRAPAEVAALPGVACVIGNSHKHQLADLVLPVLSDFGPRGASSATVETDFGWRSASSAAIEGTKSAAALAAEGKAFVPLASLTTEAHHRKPEAGSRKLEAESRKPKPETRLYVSNIFAHTELLAAPVFEVANAEIAGGDGQENQRTRPNLKVQDGCDNRCSFCVIPFVRGQSRSLPLEQILREVNALVTAGYREVVISGINLGRWGRDLDLGPRTSDLDPYRSCSDHGRKSEVRSLRSDAAVPKPEARSPKPALESLIRAILSGTQLEKLRISSVEPMDWSSNLIALMASSPRIARHAHVPLQSGSDAVLRRMHRKYRPWHYREKIEQIRAAMPSAAIGADVMAGFPGETDAEFEATRRLIDDLPFTYLHVFTYSARPGTPAALMPDQVPVHVARERNRILRDLAAGKKLAFMQSFIGRPLDAITLSVVHNRPDGEVTEALTDNYQKLYLKGRRAPNRWITAHIEGVEDGALVGSQAIPVDSPLEVAA